MRRGFVSLVIALLLAAPAQAQGLFGDGGPSRSGGLGGGLFGGGNNSKPAAQAVLIAGDEPGIVSVQVQVTVPAGANTYSQDPTFAKPTKIILSNADGWRPLDPDFVPDHPPKRSFDDNFGKEVEKFEGEVVFLQRFQLPAGMTAESASLEGVVDCLVCDNSICLPHKLPFAAKLAATSFVARDVAFPVTAPAQGQISGMENPVAPAAAPPAAANPLVREIVPLRSGGKTDPVAMTFSLSSRTAQPGDRVTLSIRMRIDDGWSTYGLVKAAADQIPLPTRIKVEPTNLTPAGDMRDAIPPKVVVTDIDGRQFPANTFYREAAWEQEFIVADAGPYSVGGDVTYQLCEADRICLPPLSVAFLLEADGPTGSPGNIASPPTLLAANGNSSSADGISTEELAALFPVDGSAASGLTFGGALWGAFLAGLIMNIMPCVLPVLSIKILSFVQQAGESRGRIVALNFAYTLGVMSFFMALAVVSWGLGQSISSLFQSQTFMMVLGGVFFLMALSLLGVFELPVPGIIPSAGDHQEGYAGAFTTGIIATILGTPCIAPFIAPVFTWTLDQSAPVVFLTFGMMGLGMASPYLLTGLFPALVNWLPRPGMWMVRFKQFTGFLMLATVLFVMASIDLAHLIPYLVVLLALGFAAWMVGTYAPPVLSYAAQLRGYAVAAILISPLIWYSVTEIKHAPLVGVWGAPLNAPVEKNPVPGHLPWQSFAEDRIVAMRKAGQPMIIDFTANWCAICKANERLALNTEKTSRFVEEHRFTAIVADFTSEDPQMLKWLRHFGQESVPLTIIVPPGADSRVIVLPGAYFQGGLLAKLEEAVGSGSFLPGGGRAPQRTALDGGEADSL